VNSLQLTEPDANGTVGVTIYRAAEYSRKTQADIVAWQNIPGVKYNYSGFTTTPPPPLPPLNIDLDLVHWAVIVMFVVIAALIMISVVAFAIWTLIYRKKRFIRSSQPFFLVAICIGVILMSLSILALSAQYPPTLAIELSFVTDFGCMASWWFFAIGFSIAISALLAKTWRVNKVRKNEWRSGMCPCTFYRHPRSPSYP